MGRSIDVDLSPDRQKAFHDRCFLRQRRRLARLLTPEIQNLALVANILAFARIHGSAAPRAWIAFPSATIAA
jgi:hypothetical protein